MTPNAFPSWDSIALQVLTDSANRISSLGKEKLRSLVSDHVKVMQQEVGTDSSGNIDSVPSGMSVQAGGVLGIPHCLLIARFEQHPFEETELEQASGMARLLDTDPGTIPIVLVFPGATKLLIEHETIHVCQYLNPNSFPLTLDERKTLVTSNLRNVLVQATFGSLGDFTDLLARVSAYKTWIELEAYNFSFGKEDLTGKALLRSVLISAQSLAMIEGIVMEVGVNDDVMIDAEEKLKEYCEQMESQHPWIADVMSQCDNNPPPLFDALWQLNQELENEMWPVS